jgi:hypothetical protein
MIVRATVDRGNFRKGVEYDLPDSEAQAMIIAGFAAFIAVAPHENRERATNKAWERKEQRTA